MPELTVRKRLDLLHSMNHPSVYDYLPLIFEDFIEFHGDRYYGDDAAILSGIGMLKGKPVTIVAHVRGRDIEEIKKTNFSMPHPEGYRKALRIAKQAEKFHRPLICFLDTPGAFCGIGAEERGQGEAIARNLLEFMSLETPILSVVLGEGGSGGALALGVCDELAMLENSLYSVVSPRAFASILWKDANREYEAAELMKISAEDLRRFGICDKIIPEGGGSARKNIALTAAHLSEYLTDAINRFSPMAMDVLLDKRYRRFRSIGLFSE